MASDRRLESALNACGIGGSLPPAVGTVRRRDLVMPTDLAAFVTKGRSGENLKVTPSINPRLREKSAEPFWMFTMRGSELEIAAPLPTYLGSGDPLAPHMRREITDGMVRTYLVSLVLGLDEAEDGRFRLSEGRLADLLERPRYELSSAPGRRRLSRGWLDRIRGELRALGRLYVERGPDGRSADSPEPLVNRIAVGGTDYYVHARVIWDSMTGRRARDFTQIPRSILKLNAPRIPLALGLARILRKRIVGVLQGQGHYETSLNVLAREVGENTVAGIRRHGSGGYWRGFAERITEVACRAEIAEVHIWGVDPDSLVWLVPREPLARAYAGLLAAHARKVERERLNNGGPTKGGKTTHKG